MIVYLVQDIPPFVMHCVYGESGSSLLIESTDSMIVDSMILTTTQSRRVLGNMHYVGKFLF